MTAWIRGQTTLWEFEHLLLEAPEEMTGMEPEANGPRVTGAWDPRMYLFKGERLRSLARKHFERRGLAPTDLERKLYALPIENGGDKARDAAMLKLRGFVGNLLRGLKAEGDECALAISRLTGGRVTVIPRPEFGVLRDVLRGAPDDEVIEVRVNGDGSDELSFFSLKNAATDVRKKRISVYLGQWLVQDARTVIAYCVAYAEAEKACRDEGFLREAEETKDPKTDLMRQEALRLAACYEIARSCAAALPKGSISRRGFTEMVNEKINQNAQITVLLPDGAKVTEAEINLVGQLGIRLLRTDRTTCQLRSAFAESISWANPITEAANGPLFAEDLSFVHDGARALWRETLILGGFPGFSDCFFKNSRFGSGKRSFMMRHFAFSPRFGRSTFDAWLLEAFLLAFSRKKAMAERIRECEEEERGHARSFENKARLPERTVRAMSESPLNECFGFVEYDEDVDLERAAVFERTFLDVRRRFLSAFDASKNAIRLRRLGNHRATGLYYPGVKCLCVDYRHPESFLHEFGHLMDYEGGDLSLSAAFAAIRKEYGAWIDAHADKIPKRGKYDRSYFLTPTEIFARSFETYCKRALGLTCCLLPETFNEAVYPTGERYDGLVAEYFDRLLRQKEGGDLRESA